MSEILYMLEPGHEVTQPQSKKRKNLQAARGGDAPLLRQFQEKTARLIHLKSGNFLLDFLDSEDLQDEGVVSVM